MGNSTIYRKTIGRVKGVTRQTSASRIPQSRSGAAHPYGGGPGALGRNKTKRPQNSVHPSFLFAIKAEETATKSVVMGDERHKGGKLPAPGLPRPASSSPGPSGVESLVDVPAAGVPTPVPGRGRNKRLDEPWPWHPSGAGAGAATITPTVRDDTAVSVLGLLPSGSAIRRAPRYRSDQRGYMGNLVKAQQSGDPRPPGTVVHGLVADVSSTGGHLGHLSAATRNETKDDERWSGEAVDKDEEQARRLLITHLISNNTANTADAAGVSSPQPAKQTPAPILKYSFSYCQPQPSITNAATSQSNKVSGVARASSIVQPPNHSSNAAGDHAIMVAGADASEHHRIPPHQHNTMSNLSSDGGTPQGVTLLHGKAMQTNANQCKPMQNNANQCNEIQKQCNAMQINAKQCNSMQCKAMQSNAKHQC